MKNPSSPPQEIVCPSCHSHFFLQPSKRSPSYFCPFCGASLHPHQKENGGNGSSSPTMTSIGTVSIVEGHLPHPQNVLFSLGPYQIIRSIGQGGMGEVFLAYDTTCGRRIALKRIRTDLLEHTQLYHRFLKEARITCQLTHPSVIPIYAIHQEQNLLYYTMPYVEGETLKEILRKARVREKKGEKGDYLSSSIPALVRILLSICQAVAYAHSKGVLHRDLKPENIIIGKYGEVMILDWGLAKIAEQAEEELEESISKAPPARGVTRMGKVVGTVAYMAPERAAGQPANPRTDIYSLGVILYQILTLHLPFRRGTLTEFRKTMHEEEFIDPIEIAPYRDVPKSLAGICHRCLAANPEERYVSVDELIRDLESYIEGRSEWFLAKDLDIHKKADWEFQENVLIAEHVAITRHAEVSDWVNLMISSASFSGNTKMEVDVFLEEKSHGIGFLLSIPEAGERHHLNDGYCLWLGSDSHPSTKLLRSTVEVLTSPEVFLHRLEWYHVRIEKIDNNLYFYLNDILQFSYISHLPLVGTHVGLIARDADFHLKNLKIFVGSQNVMVNCLAVPDAFLANKDYPKALHEYRRIGYSFPGRAEGREAMFRAGITLLEQARNTPNLDLSKEYSELALQEFEKLHNTPGAPLEYLGKALVYQSLHEYEEEIKCYALACRRYAQHPLLPVIKEQIVYRMHESSRQQRMATYHLIYLVVRHLPEIASSNHSQKMFHNLQKHWEVLPFLEGDPSATTPALQQIVFAIPLAFWLAKPYFLGEILDDLRKNASLPVSTIGNAFFSLIELGAWNYAQQKLEEFSAAKSPQENALLSLHFDCLRIALLSHQEDLNKVIQTFFTLPPHPFSAAQWRTLVYLMQRALQQQQFALVEILFQRAASLYAFSFEQKLLIDTQRVWAFLFENQWNAALQLLTSYPPEYLHRESSPLHFLYGCWLQATQGVEKARQHFATVLEISYPRSWALATHFLNGKISTGWTHRAFLWEKLQLYRQLQLYYHCAQDFEKVEEFRLQEENLSFK